MKRGFQRIYIPVFVLTVSALFCACMDDDFFGKSPLNEITEFTVPGQFGNSVIINENNTVDLQVGADVDRTKMVPSSFEISNFARAIPSGTEARNFTDPVEYIVRAENGAERVWTITIDEIADNPQLENSDFDLWYETSAGIIGTPIDYFEPGESEDNTLWSTANYGLTYYKSQPNTTPLDLEGGDFAAKMVTAEAPAVVDLAAATVFTGIFDLNIANPTASAQFGIPFSATPSGFTVNYTYVPGSENIGVTADECDIYVLLEKRVGDAVARVATGWFRSGTNTGEGDWVHLEVDLIYGPLSSADPEYDYANIKGDDTWAAHDDIPTHISVVFSSSALGDEYKGAIGSTLVVDDFELIYE